MNLIERLEKRDASVVEASGESSKQEVINEDLDSSLENNISMCGDNHDEREEDVSDLPAVAQQQQDKNLVFNLKLAACLLPATLQQAFSSPELVRESVNPQEEAKEDNEEEDDEEEEEEECGDDFEDEDAEVDSVSPARNDRGQRRRLHISPPQPTQGSNPRTCPYIQGQGNSRSSLPHRQHHQLQPVAALEQLERLRSRQNDEPFHAQSAQSRAQQRLRVRRLDRSRTRHPVVTIRSRESTEWAMRKLLCLALLCITLFCTVFYLTRNMSRSLHLVFSCLLLTSLTRLFRQYQQVRADQRAAGHSNQFFSYAFESGQSQGEAADLNDEEAVAADYHARILRRRALLNGHAENDENHNSNLRAAHRNRRHLQSQVVMQLILQMIQSHFIFSLDSNAAAGFSEEQISSIGAMKYSEVKEQLKIDQNDKESSDTSCVICLDGFSDDNDTRLLKCKHFFHLTCLDEWLKKKRECPVCRQPPLDTPQPQPPVSAAAAPPQPERIRNGQSLLPLFIEPLQIRGGGGGGRGGAGSHLAGNRGSLHTNPITENAMRSFAQLSAFSNPSRMRGRTRRLADNYHFLL